MFWEPLDVDRWILAAREQAEAFQRAWAEHHERLLNPPAGGDTWSGENARLAREQTELLQRAEAAALFLTVSVNHLRKALQRTNPEFLQNYDGDLFDRARTLRNVWEHWDETRSNFSEPDSDAKQSVKDYKARHPKLTPWSISWHPESGLVIGGILPLEPLGRLIGDAQSQLGRDRRT